MMAKRIKNWNSNALFIYLWKIDWPFLQYLFDFGENIRFSHIYVLTNIVTKNKLMLKDVTKLSGAFLITQIKQFMILKYINWILVEDYFEYVFTGIFYLCSNYNIKTAIDLLIVYIFYFNFELLIFCANL